MRRRWVRELRQSGRGGSTGREREREKEGREKAVKHRLKRQKEAGAGGKYVTGCGFPELAEHQYAGIVGA